MPVFSETREDTIIHGLGHVPRFSGSIWFVDPNGNDNNSGEDPDEAFATIATAISTASAGDAITLLAGTYDENGLDLNKYGLELWAKVGVVLVDTTGSAQTLLVSASSCKIKGLLIAQAGQIGLKITGSLGVFEDVKVVASTIAFDIDASQTILRDCKAVDYTTTAFDIANKNVEINRAIAQGDGSSTRGFYFSNAAADECNINNSTSVGNATSGFEVISGCSYNTIKDSASGGGDGPRIDLGSKTQWANFIDQLPREHHEHIYPSSDGEGTSATVVTITNEANNNTDAARTDQFFLGGAKSINSHKYTN